MTPRGGSWWWLMVGTLCCLASCEIRSACDYCDCYEDPDGYRAANCTTSAFSAHHRKPAGTDIRVLNLRPLHYQHHDHYSLLPRMFHSFKNVEVLDLSNCSIGPSLPDHTFFGLQYVVEIDLSYNRIRDLNGAVFLTLRNLKTLVLRGNYPRTTPRNALVSASLVELDMGHCRIESIPEGFLKTPSLRRLYLDDNSIYTIGYDVLPRELGYLNLGRNNIVNVPVEVLRSLTYLKTLDLTVNPVNCTCRLLLFQDEFSGRGNFFENVTCAYPARYQGQGINEINEDELCRHESSINHINWPLYPLKVVADRSGKFSSYDQVMGDQPATDDGDTGTWLPDAEADEKHEPTDSAESETYYGDEGTAHNDTEHEDLTSSAETKGSTEDQTSPEHEGPSTPSTSQHSEAAETSFSSPIPLLDADDTLPDLAEPDQENSSPSSRGNTDVDTSSEATPGPADYLGTDEGSGDGETDTARSEETLGPDVTPLFVSSTTEPTEESIDETDSTETEVRELTSPVEETTTTVQPEEETSPSAVSSTTEETETSALFNGTDSTDFEFSDESTTPEDDYSTTDETSETTTETPPLLSSSTTEDSTFPDETATVSEEETETTSSDSTVSGSSTTETSPVDEEEAETTTDEIEESTTTTVAPEVSEASSETTSGEETSGTTDVPVEETTETEGGVYVHPINTDETTSPESEETSTTDREEVLVKAPPEPTQREEQESEQEGGFTNEEFKREHETLPKKQSTGSYIVVGLIAVLVLGLIVLAVCKKRRHDKKKAASKIRLPHDAESNLGTEMRDMDSLLPKPPENGVKILPKDYGEPQNGEVKEEARPVLLQEEENLPEPELPEQNGTVQKATVRLSVLPEPVVQTPVFIHKPYPDD